jgi:hypothetical protein
MVPAERHPSTEELRAFGNGLLDLASASDVETHVAACPACCETLRTVPDDNLVRELKAITSAREMQADTLVAERPSTPGPAAASGATHSGADPLPPELASHPRYRVLRPLGRGGMGMVYLAEHRLMERPVALKVIHPHYIDSPASVERFRREVKAAAKLAHPNIVAAHDADQAGETHFLVMEYLAGVTLRELLERHGPLPVADACAAVRQAALGLQHAYERGMVHRDVKPHNLILTPDGTIKVLDFGLASLAEGRDTTEGLTGPGAMMGTPDYMAPEQAENPRAADTRADIYSLGCTLFQLLTGRVPFPAESLPGKLLAHRDRPPQVRAALPDAPPELVAVLERMLAKDPADRYQTPAEVAQALAPFAGASAAPPATPRPALRPVRRRLILLGALGAALVVAAFLIVRVQTDSGEVVLKTDDPDMQVTVTRGGAVVRITDTRGKQTWELDTRKYRISLADRPDGLPINLGEREAVVLKRQGKDVLTITRTKRPPTSEELPGLDEGGALDFAEVHGLDGKRLKTWLGGLEKKGFRPTLVSNHTGGRYPRFSAIAVKGANPVQWLVHLGMDARQSAEDFHKQGEEYRCGGSLYYREGGAEREAHLWVRDQQKWFAIGVPVEEAPERILKASREGWRLVHACAGPGGGRLAAALAFVEGGPPWEAYFGRSGEELAKLVAAQQARGWRPVHVAAYEIDGRTSFLAVLVENRDRVGWAFRLGLSAAEYEREVDRQRALGLRPLAVAAYTAGGRESYAVVWARYRAAGK